MLFVKVAESENDESVEIPVESEGHILMTTLTAQYPGACGLKFKTEQSSWRGVRVADDKLYPPGDDTWDSSVYIVTFPKDSKRKGEDLDVNTTAIKSRKIERKCVDLIVLGIPWKSTEDVVRHYFDQYGEVVLCEIKRDSSNNSKGFGFVRFKDYASQSSVLGKKHFIDGRWCDVKIPNSQEPETSRKIFVGRLTENLTSKDLQEYFSQYGQVIDVYIPKPFRAFGFVTFVEADIAQGLCGESHIIKGVSVHVSRADPKEDENGSSGPGNYGHHSMGHFGHHNRDGPPRRYQSNGHMGGGGPYGHHSHHNSSHNLNGNGGMPPSHMGNSGPPSSKSMGHLPRGGNKMIKYDNHHPSDSFDSQPRHNDVRSPNMPHTNGTGGGAGAGSDQMNAMMNMFNPMMAAFIQQLASGIQPNGSSSQSSADGPSTHNGGPASGGNASQSSQWQGPGDYHPGGRNGANNNLAVSNQSGGGYNSGYSNGNGVGSGGGRFKA